MLALLPPDVVSGGTDARALLISPLHGCSVQSRPLFLPCRAKDGQTTSIARVVYVTVTEQPRRLSVLARLSWVVELCNSLPDSPWSDVCEERLERDLLSYTVRHG